MCLSGEEEKISFTKDSKTPPVRSFLSSVPLKGHQDKQDPYFLQREATEEPHQVHKTTKTIIAVKEFQHGSKGEADGEKHGSMAAS